MKSWKSMLFLLALPARLFAGEFMAGDSINVTSSLSEDLYVVGGEIRTKAPLQGDLVVTGGDVDVHGRVAGDILAGGGRLRFAGPAGDDIRAFGGDIRITGGAEDDVIALGGRVELVSGAAIGGDLIAGAGQLRMDGAIGGDVRAFGGECSLNGGVAGDLNLTCGSIHINGEIRGNARLRAEEITIGDEAKFGGVVEYWNDAGELNAGSSGGEFHYIEERESRYFGADSGFSFVSVLWALVLILFFVWLIPGVLRQAGENLRVAPLPCLGYGVAFFLLVPLAAIVLFISVIGIPLGFLLTMLYASALLAGRAIAALLFAPLLQEFLTDWRPEKISPRMIWIVTSFLIVIVLELFSAIPVLGFFVTLLTLFPAMGSLLYVYLKKTAAS